MKIFSRLVILNMIIAYIIALISPFEISKPIGDFNLYDWFILVWAFVSIIALLILLVFIFYHWGVTEFGNKSIKQAWFIIILIGTVLYFLGPLLYYIVVIEMKRGCKRA